MSRKAPIASPKADRVAASRKTDRRVVRTRDALGDALVALMHETPFRAITVQQVLDRAHVSRSTFYAHYRDKDDLFFSDVDEFFERMATQLSRRREASTRVAPVRELFAHVAEWQKFHAALVTSGKVHDVLELGQAHFARAIDARLRALPAAAGLAPTRRTAMAHALAGALVALLAWWLDHGAAGSPAELDDLYHQMVWSGVCAQLPRAPARVARSPTSAGM
jgi:AcrR family transcriptional regulator